VDTYLYISPPFGTAAGTYTITVNAKSDYSESSVDVDAEIISEVTAPVEPPVTGEEENVTGEEENITLEINETGGLEMETTPGNLTGLFVGDEDRPFWKTATVAVITIIIIIILIVRFAFLWRK
jgi:hypothetical protein